VAIEVFVELHALHVSRSVIAKLTGYSAMYVGMVLFDLGAHERWDHAADVRADLPSALRESCDNLIAGHQPDDLKRACVVLRGRKRKTPPTRAGHCPNRSGD
jgi:hypothetical protein